MRDGNVPHIFLGGDYMTLTLYTNQSDSNVVQKNLQQLTVLNGTLREGCSIVDPVILVDASALPSNTLASCNYAHILEFNRYYYINDINTERNGLYRITMHSDVLKNAEQRLFNLSAVIRRTADIDRANLYLTDDTYKAEQRKKIQTLLMEADETYGGFQKSGNYILTVMGTQPTTQGGE